MGTYEAGGLSVGHMSRTNRITAKETINGVDHLVVLESDATGRYQEVSLAQIQRPNRGWVDPSVFLG